MGVPLAEALAQLRRELYQAQDAGAGEQFRFEVEQAELSLDVEFHSDGKGGVKVEVGAFGARAGVEAAGEVGRTRRQTLKLTLRIRDEALGGQRAVIRRTTGGLDDGDLDDGDLDDGDLDDGGLDDGGLPDGEDGARSRPRES